MTPLRKWILNLPQEPEPKPEERQNEEPEDMENDNDFYGVFYQ